MRNYKPEKNSFYKKRTTFFIEKDFQLKFIAILIGSAMAGMIVSAFPQYYYVSQNYKIFEELALTYEPQLFDHLSRELSWMKVMMGICFVSLFCFFGYFGFRFSSQIIAPIKILNYHLKFLSRGQWHLNPIKIRANDEFHELIDNYNYFYASFKTQLEKDLTSLNEIQDLSTDEHQKLLFHDFMYEKRQQLGLLDEPPLRQLNIISLRDAKTEPPRVRHRAS